MATLFDQASLVMIPSGYKDDKLYSIKPTDGSGDFTFSRDGAGASPATRVNASGLIEKGRENVLTYSNDFSNAAWVKTGVTPTSGQSGYDGTSDAWLLSSTNTTGEMYQLSSNSFVSTISLRVKAGSTNWLAFRILATNGAAWFNLSTGSFATIQSAIIDTNVESLGGGWYEISVTAATSGFLAVYLANGDNTFASTSGNSIYIQDAQLESGLVATDYIETTTAPVSAGLLGDMPRLDYSGGATCPSLLLEPSRTNIVDDSEYVTGYFNQSGAVVSYNEIISPEGVQNAFKLTSTTNGQARIEKSRPVGGTDTYTLSVFLKAGNSNFASLANFNRNASVRFNLADGTIQGSGNVVDADIIPMGNGWYRCYMVMQEQASQTANIYKILVSSDGETYFANNGDYIYGYGAQLESGSYPTSYIPTYGSAAPRAKDAPSLTSVSDLIGQEEGTFFIEWDNIGDTSRPYLALSAGGSTANRVLIYESSGVNAQIKSGGSVVFQSTTASVSGTIKAAVAYKTNDFVFYVNGTQYGTDSSGATFSGTTLNEVEFDHANLVGASMKQCVVFKTRLTNAELAALTA